MYTLWGPSGNGLTETDNIFTSGIRTVVRIQTGIPPFSEEKLAWKSNYGPVQISLLPESLKSYWHLKTYKLHKIIYSFTHLTCLSNFMLNYKYYSTSLAKSISKERGL